MGQGPEGHADAGGCGDQKRHTVTVCLIIAKGFGEGDAVLEPGVAQVQQGEDHAVQKQRSRQAGKAQHQVHEEETQNTGVAAQGVNAAVVDVVARGLIGVGLLKGKCEEQTVDQRREPASAQDQQKPVQGTAEGCRLQAICKIQNRGGQDQQGADEKKGMKNSFVCVILEWNKP